MNTNESMKIILAGLGILGLVFLGIISYERVWKIQQGPFPQPSQITVDGQGKVTAIPNIAESSFTVITEGLTPQQVQSENNKLMEQVIGHLKKSGVEAKDIKTTGYYLSPKYEYRRVQPSPLIYPYYPPEGTPIIVGYTLRQTVLVKIRDLNKAGEIVAGVAELGVNEISGISFNVDDDRIKELQNEARLKAFVEARQKAESMSKAVGVRLGRVISFSENFYGGPIPYFAKAELGIGGGGAAPVPAPVEPGSQEISVNVNVTYQLR